MTGFNSNEYGWKDVTIGVDGQVMLTALGISFKDDVERELIYGKGDKPIGVNDGNVKYEGELKIHQSELQKLMLLKGNKGTKGLRDLTIVVAYSKGLRVTTRTLIGCAITSSGEGYNQNDKFAEITLPFIFLDIVYA